MTRTSFVLLLAVPAALVGCLQDFNQFEPNTGGASTTASSASSPTSTTTTTTTTSSVSSSISSSSGGTCTPTDLTGCDTSNVCVTVTCPSGTCVSTPVPDGTAPGYLEVTTDCVTDTCTDGVLAHDAPADSEIPDDLSICTIDTCVGGTPMHAPDTSQNGNQCGAAPNIVCQDGVCQGCSGPGDCGTPPECQKNTCDGSGVCGTAPDHEGDLTGSQTSGDCKKRVCQGGAPTLVPDDADIMDDGAFCSTDTCSGGTIHHDPIGNGTNCGTGPACASQSTFAPQDTCQGIACQSPANVDCAPFACVGSACKTACANTTDCMTGLQCELDAGANQNKCVECVDDMPCTSMTATPHCEQMAASGQWDTCVECRQGMTDCTTHNEGHACQTDGTCGCGTAMVASPDCVLSTDGLKCRAGHACGCDANTDCTSNSCNTSTHVCM